MKQYFLTSYNFKEIDLIQSPIDNHDNFWLPWNNRMHIQQIAKQLVTKNCQQHLISTKTIIAI
jgi:hypothetical protein